MTKIMLVEDDNNLREIYQARLAAEGYQIVAAPDGEAALALAAKEHPDLVISDVMMPKISGFEMLDILRNTDGLKNVRVIMLTALGQAEDKGRADNLGADRYLVKSQVTLEDIVKAAHDVLDNVPTGPTPESAAAPAPAAPAVTPAEPAAATPAPAATPPVDPIPAAPVAAVPTISMAQPPSDTPAPATPAADAAAPAAPVEVPIEPAAPAPEAAAPAPAEAGSTQSIATEEAAVQAQIENFISKQGATDAAAATQAAAPVVDAVAPAAPASTPSDNQAVNAAVDSLIADSQANAAAAASEAAPAESTPPPTAAPAPEAAAPDTPPQGVSGKKVISPIDAPEKPDINALLAVEEAKEAAQQAAPQTPPAAPNPGTPPATPGGSDPNSIAL